MALLHSATGWWIDEAGAPQACEPLQGFTDADHVVIGGGYLGMWSAWHLLEREPEANVVLLEAGSCGHGPSGRNGGFVNGYWDHVPAHGALRRRARGRDRARRRRVDQGDRRLLRKRRGRRLVPRGAAGRHRHLARAGRSLERFGRGAAGARPRR